MDSQSRTNSQQRQLVWVENREFTGFGCSECGWVFNPSDKPPIGRSLDEMKRNFAHERDKFFAAHDCTKLPKT
jgi:hypothetical protein